MPTKRRLTNRYSATAKQRPRKATSDQARKPRHENGGQYDGDNKATLLVDFCRVIHKTPDRRKAVE